MNILIINGSPKKKGGASAFFSKILNKLEEFCIDKKCKFRLYVISNSGFVGGKQNNAHLEQYKCWCEHSGITWGGGLGIGGAVMLHVIFYLIFLLGIVQFAAGIIFNIGLGHPIIDNHLLNSFIRSMIIWLFLCSGMLFCELKLAWQ